MSSKPGTWQPGQSGNPNGRPRKGLALTDVLREHMELSDEGDSVPRKVRLAERLYELAMAGNVSAIEYIANRLDGKPTQAIALVDGSNPLHHQVNVRTSGRRRSADDVPRIAPPDDDAVADDN